MKNVMIVLGVVLIFLGMIVGCEQKGSNGEKNKEVGKSEEEFVGRYVNQDDPRKYVELKSDYTVYKKEKFPWGDYYEVKGKWKTGSDELLLIGPLGGVDRCKIKGNTLIDEDGKIWTKQGETGIITKETSSEDKISGDADRIPGRYIMEGVEEDGTIKRSPGITIFKKDGTIDSGFAPGLTWRLNKNGTIQLYQGGWRLREGRIEGDAIVFERNGVELRYIKQNGHPLPISSTKLREPENLSSPSGIGLEQETKPKSMYDSWEEEEKRLRAKPATELKFKKLSMEDEIQARQLWEWVVSQRKMARLPVVGYGQMVKTCRNIIRRWPESEYAFKAKRALADLPERYRKTYNITKEETDLSQTLGHSNLSQQINRKREIFADSSVFPKPHVSLTLRAMAPDLVEKVETLYLAALDYQFLSLKSLRYARASLDDSDLAMAKNYTEKADRYYRVAVALQRDSQAVLDGTYSAAETATKGIKDACQTATTLGLKVINPVAGKVVDYVYVGVDYAVEQATIGADEAGKNALKRLIVKALFKEVEFSALGNRTIADYIGSRIGKDVFPLLDKLLRSEEAKFAILNIIKESGVKVSEEVLLREILGVGK